MSRATGVYRAEWVFIRKSSFTFPPLQASSQFSAAQCCVDASEIDKVQKINTRVRPLSARIGYSNN